MTLDEFLLLLIRYQARCDIIPTHGGIQTIFTRTVGDTDYQHAWAFPESQLTSSRVSIPTIEVERILAGLGNAADPEPN